MEFEKKVVELDVNDVLPNRFQPRIKFNEDSINELSESIKEHGVIQPIVVRVMGDKYEIIAGERRYKASLLAGKQTIPAIITDLNDKDSAEVALIENVQRKDLTPIEEAISYKKILDMGYLTQEELANKLGKNQGTVANKLRLLNLDDEVQEAVLEEKISERHARSLLKLKDKKQQVDMLNNIIENRLTVRKTDEAISNLLNSDAEKVEKKEEPVIINEIEEYNPFDVTKTLNMLEERGEDDMIEEFNPFRIEEPKIIADNELNADMLIQSNPVDVFGAPTLLENSNTINPGFMDINNIEENAKDIKTEEPIADMNSLLTPINLPNINSELVQTVETQPELNTSRFFNLPIEEENDLSTFSSEKTLEDLFQPNIGPKANENDNNMISSSELFNFNFENNISPVASSNSSLDSDITTNLELSEQPKIEEMKFNPSVSTIAEVPVESFDSFVSNESIPSAISTPVISDQIPAGNRIMEALTIVRNCSKELERLGFLVDVEEIDFENLYQFIIKIQK